MDIDKLAKELYEDILQAYKDNPDLSMQEIMDNYLEPFNEELSTHLESIIDDMLTTAAVMGASQMKAVPLSVPKLSKALYNNAKNVAIAASKVINEHIANKSTIADLREALYDGYGYDELLDIKKDAPGFIAKKITPEYVDRLKTKPLKAAYIKILEAENDAQLKKAMKIAIEEKSRYYALRIADTEEARAFNLANAANQLKEGVKYVKWTLSFRHSVPCICDIFANQDVGYGRGVYPIREAPVPVYSTHPHCKCSLRDYYREPAYKPVKDPLGDAIDGLPVSQQPQALGSKAKWRAWKAGKSPEAIFNQGRKDYPILTVGDLF